MAATYPPIGEFTLDLVCGRYPYAWYTREIDIPLIEGNIAAERAPLGLASILGTK
jgi:hypothetical protein